MLFNGESGPHIDSYQRSQEKEAFEAEMKILNQDRYYQKEGKGRIGESTHFLLSQKSREVQDASQLRDLRWLEAEQA